MTTSSARSRSSRTCKSRLRHNNDNALAECKNGAVIRKLMGYGYIVQQHARIIDPFYANSMNSYLNFHRPCFFAVDKLSPKGKLVKTYPHDQIMTPWDRPRHIKKFEQFLKTDVTARSLTEFAARHSDSQAAAQLQSLSLDWKIPIRMACLLW